MDKILVNIFVPIINSSYDMFIPVSLKVYTVLELIKKSVAEMSDGRFIANENNVLCFRGDGSIIDINLSALETEIKNGSRLMLI